MGIRSELEASFDFEIIDEFLDHFSLMVDSMEIMILDLNKKICINVVLVNYFVYFII